MEYKLLDDITKIKLNDKYKSWAGPHLHEGEDGFTLVAIDKDIVGFMSVYRKELPWPLDHVFESYIDVIKVDDDYKKRGIGSKLLKAAEKWSKDNNVYQIRAWSSLDKTEIIPLWHKLNYSLCPAQIWNDEHKEVIRGFYVVKRFT